MWPLVASSTRDFVCTKKNCDESEGFDGKPYLELRLYLAPRYVIRVRRESLFRKC